MAAVGFLYTLLTLYAAHAAVPTLTTSSASATSSPSSIVPTFPNSSSSHLDNVGPSAEVIGIVVVVAVVGALLLLGIMQGIRKRRRKRAATSAAIGDEPTSAPGEPSALTAVQPSRDQAGSLADVTPGNAGEETSNVSWLNPASTLPATHPTSVYSSQSLNDPTKTVAEPAITVEYR
ncbi:hypothetical protein K438DRAFT_1859943 [Mycena galopus ATCC 62051]|nr:hypothetical protein K438DRAFT_1859943 [Mycena galopus ATCC 62051]